MLGVSIRRLRPDAVAVLIGLAAVGALALVTGPPMTRQFHDSGLADCLALGPRAACQPLIDSFGQRFGSLERLILPLVLLPGLLGAFVGAPLVARELESRTCRFLWTQSVTRQRWFASSAGTAIALALAAGGAYAAIVAAWLDTTNAVTDDRFGRLYDFQGVVPVAAAAFAVALGVLCGLVARRTLPAMAATIGVFVAVRLAMAAVVRPRLAAPVTRVVPFTPDGPVDGSGAWELSRVIVDAEGTVLGDGGTLRLGALVGRCPGLDGARGGRLPDPALVDACLRDIGVRTVVRYHPADRFWPFQLAESAILLGLGGACVALALVLLGRRTP